MAEQITRLGQFESKAIVALSDRTPGVYSLKLSIAGNSILSTVFVEDLDPGASVLVEYFDYGVGEDAGESYVLPAHDAVSSPLTSNRILISKLHDKPRLRATVTGGNVTFGVYATIVASSASDIDSALQRENEVVSLVTDKGIPITVYDAVNGVWRFARGELGIQDVRIVGNVAVGEPGAATFIDSETLTTPGLEQTLISYTVPAPFHFNLLSMQLACRSEASFKIYGDGSLIGSGRTGAAAPNVNFPYRVARTFLSGKIIEVKATARDGSAVAAIEAYIQGTLS